MVALFRDFINHCQIEEVKLKLKDRNNSNKSIFDITSAGGCSDRLFKKQVRITPKKFLDQHSINSNELLLLSKPILVVITVHLRVL